MSVSEGYRTCEFEGCDWPYHSRGYCSTHYGQQKKGRSLTPRRPYVPVICKIVDCERHVYARKMCSAHWQQVSGGKEPRGVRKMRAEYDAQCSFGGCGRPSISLGHCWSHYAMLRNGEELRQIAEKSDQVGICEVGFCGRSKVVRGMCRQHHALRRNYTLTAEQIHGLFSDPMCAICKTRESGVRNFHVDHDHACCPFQGKSCGKCVRGILCVRCNQALGMFEDDTVRVAAALAYLEAAA